MTTKRRAATDEVLMAGRLLSTAAVMFHTALAERHGLSAVESKTLDFLQRFGPLTAGELGAKSGLAPASITGLVTRLEKKGYVRRTSDAGDGRRVRIELVMEKLAAGASLFGDLVGQLEELCAKFKVEELETVARFLNEAAERQQAAAGRLGKALDSK